MHAVQHCTTDPPLLGTPGTKSLAGFGCSRSSTTESPPARHQEVVMSRIQISLSTPTLDQLRAIAGSTGEPVARVATRLLMSGLADGRSAPRAPSRPATPDVDEADYEPTVPPWLEPFDDEERRLWRRQAWGDALALYN